MFQVGSPFLGLRADAEISLRAKWSKGLSEGFRA